MARRPAPQMPTDHQVEHAARQAAAALEVLQGRGLTPSAVIIGPEGVRFEFAPAAAAPQPAPRGRGLTLDDHRARRQGGQSAA